MFSKILVGLDGSDGSKRALEAAIAIAEKFGGTLHALSVMEPAGRYAGTVGEVDEEMRSAETYLADVQDQARAAATRRGIAFESTILRGHPAVTLAQMTRTAGIDLVVVGQSGRSNVWGTFLGTTADKISRHAGCSVLIVR